MPSGASSQGENRVTECRPTVMSSTVSSRNSAVMRRLARLGCRGALIRSSDYLVVTRTSPTTLVTLSLDTRHSTHFPCPSTLSPLVPRPSSKEQLQPQTQDGRCVYALFVDAWQHPQRTSPEAELVFLSPSDDL